MSQLPQTEIERLYLKFEKPLYNFVYRWVWHAQDSHEIVQDTFVRLWQHRENLDETTIQALIYKIALNLARNHHRKKISMGKLFDHLINFRQVRIQSAETNSVEIDQRERVVRSVVEVLPERYRSVLMMCQFSEMSYEEVAEVLKIPAGTVASRKNKALELMKAQLIKKGIYEAG